jgi:hypothetical protein
VTTKKEDPPIDLNTMYIDRQRDNNSFLSFLGHEWPLPEQLYVRFQGLRKCHVFEGNGTHWPKYDPDHMEMCVDIDSKRVKVYGLCENVEVILIDFPHITLHMNIIVIDVPDTWGMLLSRSWFAALGGFLSIDLTHAQIPMGDATFEILDSRERADKYVMEPNGHDYTSECEFDKVPDTIEYDPRYLPFMQEDCIYMLLTKTDEYT